MAKLEAKVLLAIGAASILFSLVGGVFLFAMMGELHWSQLLAVAAIAILIDGATILVWLLAARQIRRERVHATKLVLRELGILGADVREGVDSLRNALESVQHQEVDQGERQRKILNTLRSESRSHRARIEKIAATQNRLRSEVNTILENLSGPGNHPNDIGEGNSRARSIAEIIETLGSSQRKTLNIVRGELRESRARELKLHSALVALKESNSTATAKIEDTSVAVKKMHNFIRREGSIQVALDRFTAAERRMLAAVEAAGLDHADEVAALHARIGKDRLKDDSELAKINSDLASGLRELRRELVDSVTSITAELDGLSALTSSVVGRGSSDASSSREAMVQALALLEDRIGRLEENLSSRVSDDDSLCRASATEVEAPGSDAGSATSEHLQLSVAVRANESVIRTVVQAQTGRLEQFIKHQSIDVVRQVEALSQLLPRVETLERRYPPLGWWALPADAILFLSDYIERERPKNILEIGSGSSTVWLGAFARMANAKVVSLEHDRTFAQKSQEMIESYGLQDVVTVHHADLREMELGGKSFNWYDSEVVQMLKAPFDVLVVDGPPESTGDKARMPALPVLEPLLSATCLVLLDDTHRDAEQEILQEWLEEYRDFEHLNVDLMRTDAILRQL